MSRLVFQEVCFNYVATPLLENLSFSCGEKERICLVGPNGVGKSTVLALARGDLEPSAGQVERSGTISPLPVVVDVQRTQTLADLLSIAAAPFKAAESEFAQASAALEDPHLAEQAQTQERFAQSLATMEALEAWTWQERAAHYLSALGALPGHVVTEGNLADALDRPLTQLSGGQLARAHLAFTLLSRPEVLLLDEPTNHLDPAGVDFLTKIVNAWPGPVLYASHDRAFIEATATALLDLDTAPWQALADSGQLSGVSSGTVLGAYKCQGAYRHYLQAKAAARATHIELHAAQQREKHRLEAHEKRSEVVGHRNAKPRSEVRAAQKFYADRAQKVSTRRISDDQRRLGELQQREVQRPRYTELSPTLPPAVTASGVAVSVRDLSVAGRLPSTSFEVHAGEKLLLVGPNGCGKSTLLATLATAAVPQGQTASSDCAQDATATLTGGFSVAGSLAYVPQRLPLPSDLPAELWNSGVGEAGKGFVHPQYCNQPLSLLSQGNQRRAHMALCFGSTPVELLLIDEPTNYLDLDFIEALEEKLFAWPGTIICASHDQWLKDSWPGRILTLPTTSS